MVCVASVISATYQGSTSGDPTLLEALHDAVDAGLQQIAPKPWPIEQMARGGAHDRRDFPAHAGGREIRAEPQRKKIGVEHAAVAEQLPAIIGADRVGEEGAKRRRAARRDSGLVHAVIGRAEQAYVAV